MGSSLRRTGEMPPTINKGHGTRALGPSDSSDTGSDITGAPGLAPDDETLDLRRGTTSDPEGTSRSRRKGAGPDIGDENLDSDSDSGGTGERAAAGRDAPPPTDQQLDVIDEAGMSELVSGEDLERELVGQHPEVEAEDMADPDMRSASATAPSKAKPRVPKSKRPIR